MSANAMAALLPLVFHAQSAAALIPPPSPTYDMALSTYEFVGIADTSGESRFGHTALGWEFAKNGTAEAEIISAQARAIKAANNGSRVYIYLNDELALGWYDEQWAAMQDPALASLFLSFPNGTAMHDPQVSGDRGSASDQMFWVSLAWPGAQAGLDVPSL